MSPDESAPAAWTQPEEPLVHAGEMEQIREMLLGSALREIDQLRERVEELETSLLHATGRSKAVSEVLLDVAEAPSWEQGQLGAALSPEVDSAIYTSARQDSDVLAEALYPVLGPAIRKMIMNIFTGGDINEQQAFSVDQLLLIERRSGVLLAETNSTSSEALDADVISGMLDAIRLFVSDAFDTPEHDGLQDLRVGETSVVVEWGPDAVLAAVVTGTVPSEWRVQCAEMLHRFHRDFAQSLANFAGDVSVFVSAATRMRLLLESADVLASETESSSALKPAIFAAVGVVILLVAAVLVGAWLW